MDSQDDRYIVWFDIDNTLYSASTQISKAMGDRIHAYFVTLGLGHEEASELHHRYYSEYGLALRGLVRHHDVGEHPFQLLHEPRSPDVQIDPLDFNEKCDGSLPLEDMIKPDPSVRRLFQDIDRSKARVWALTNAYKPHASRVLKILNIDDQIEGLVYCDYEQRNFSCKPEAEYYHEALRKANVTDPSKCFFIDDSKNNVDAAKKLGWGRCVHFCERGLIAVEGGRRKEIGSEYETHTNDMVTELDELRIIWPEIFKT